MLLALRDSFSPSCAGDAGRGFEGPKPVHELHGTSSKEPIEFVNSQGTSYSIRYIRDVA